jgi:hypothetical protein
MFKRVNWEVGVDWIPQVAFVIFFVIFIVVTIRAIRMSKSEIDRIGGLPLNDENVQDGRKKV